MSAFRSVNDRWFPLQAMEGVENPQGEVRLRCEFLSTAVTKKQAFAGDGVEKTHFYLSIDPPPWNTMMRTVVPLLTCNDMSVRTAMANLCRSLMQSPVARKAFTEVKDSLYNLLVLYSSFHPPIKRDCAHALSVLVREVPGMSDRLYHKLKWSAVTPLLKVESPDTIIGATVLLREVAANASPAVREKLLKGMMRQIDLETLERNIRRAQTTRVGQTEYADAPELALPTFTMMSEIVADHQESRMEWCRMDDACRIMLWHVEKGATRVRRAAATLCAQLATNVECQANLFERGGDRLIYRFPHEVDGEHADLYSNSIEKDKPACVAVGCAVCRLACNSQNSEQWIAQGGLVIIEKLVDLQDASVDTCAAAALSYLASAGKLTVLTKGARVLSDYARVALAPLGTLCHSKHPEAKQHAVNAVWQLSKQLDDLSVMPAEGGIVTVFPMLYTSSQRIHAWASKFLYECAEQKPDWLDQFVHPSNFMCMLKCIRTTAVVETKKYLEDTVCLVCDEPRRRDAAFALGAYYTMQILAGYSGHLEWAVQQLFELSDSSDADAELARHVCARQGGFRVILCAIKSPEREEICRSAALAFARLSATATLHTALLQDGAAMSLPDYAKYPMIDVRTYACTALLNLSRGDKKIRLGLEEHAGFSEMKGLLESDDDQVVESVVEAIAKLTVGTKLQIKAVREEMFACLRRVILSHPSTKSHAHDALRNMCRCSIGQKFVVDNREWSALLACRLARDKAQQEWAAKCMHQLFTATKNFDLVASLRIEACMELVAYGFEAQDEDMQFNTMHAIGSLVAHCVLTMDLRKGEPEGIVYPDSAAAADAKTFLSNCQLMPCIEGMLDGHTKFEERVVLEVLGAVEYVSDCSTGLYTKPSKCKQAAEKVFEVLQHSRQQMFLSAVIEQRRYRRQTAALRALAALCNQHSVRDRVIHLFTVPGILDLCADDNVRLRPAACNLLVNLAKSPVVQVKLMTEKSYRRLVYLLRTTLGKSRALIDHVVCILAQLPCHEEAFADRDERHKAVEQCEAELAVQKRKVKEAENEASKVSAHKRRALADEATDALRATLPQYEEPVQNACDHVTEWYSQGQMFYYPDLILAVLRTMEIDWDMRVWWLQRLIVLINGDSKLDGWYARRPKIRRGAPPKTPGEASGQYNIETDLGSEKLDPFTIRALLTYGTSSSRIVQIQFLTVTEFWVKRRTTHGHIITGDAIPVLAGLCDNEDQRVKALARGILAILLQNFAVMRYFEGRADSHQMVVLASRILADNRDIQRWSSELLAHAPNPAKMTLQLLTDQDTGLVEELEAMRAMGKATVDPKVQFNIATRLYKLCATNSKIRAQVCQEGGVEAMHLVLVSDDPEVQVMALHAAIAIGNDSVYRYKLMNPVPDVAGAVCHILVNSPDQVKIAAMELIAALAFGDSVIRDQYRLDISEMPEPEPQPEEDQEPEPEPELEAGAVASEPDMEDPIPEEEPGAADEDAEDIVPADEEQAVAVQPDQVEDARAQLMAELERRETEARRCGDFLCTKLVDVAGAWDLLLRAAKPHPSRELAPGQPHARRAICALAISDNGRELLENDLTMISLVTYIERGDRAELKHWCKGQLASKAEAEDFEVQEEFDADVNFKQPKRSQAAAANAFPHLIDPIDGEDAPLRVACLRALNNQLRDPYAGKECFHYPLLRKMESCAAITDPMTRQQLCRLFSMLSADKTFQMRFCRKGYFNTVASMCGKLSEELGFGEIPSHEVGDEMVLRLLERDDAKESAVYGVTVHAFDVALRLGDLQLQRWGVVSLVELAKDMAWKLRRVKNAKHAASVAKMKALRGMEIDDRPLPKESLEVLTERAFAFARLVLPYVQNMDPDDWVQSCCMEVLQHVVDTKEPDVLDLGPDIFRMAMHLMKRESIPVQIQACKLLDVLLANGFTDFTGTGSGFMSMGLYTAPLKSQGFFGAEFRIFDSDALRTIPRHMQTWFGTRLLALEDQGVDEESDPAWESEESEEEQEVMPGTKVNPHQLVLAVCAPMLESFNSEARVAALRLMISLSSKFQQFRVRLYLYDVFPLVVRIALSAGNERLFRHSVAAEERELGRRLVCFLVADEAVRQFLLRGWKITGLLMIVQSYEPVMLGMADDESGLRKLRVWMAQSLLLCAETDEASRPQIAAKALTVMLSMISSTDTVVRHAALRCICTVLHSKDIRERTSFDPFMCRKELLRHLHLNPDVHSRTHDDLQERIDRCVLDLLNDAKYKEQPFDGDMRALLVMARRGTIEDAHWMVETLSPLAGDAMKWGVYESRCVFEVLAALVRGSDDKACEGVARIYETILQFPEKQQYFLSAGGILILAGILMSPRSQTKLAGIAALRILIENEDSRQAVLDGRLPHILTALLDVWYASAIWTFREARPAPATKSAKRLQKAARKMGGLSMLMGGRKAAAEPPPPPAVEVRDVEAARPPFAGSALQQRLKKAAKKAATLAVIPKVAAEARAREQAAIMDDSCVVLRKLLTCEETDCRRDCIQSNILSALSRTSLVDTTTPVKEFSAHSARKTLATIISNKYWALGSVFFDEEIQTFPKVLPMFPPPTAQFPDRLVLKELTFGANFCLALSWTGLVFSRGYNSNGQLGLGGTVQDCAKLTKITELTGVTNIACGEHTSAAVTEGGELYVWGCNSHGQAGRGFVSRREDAPRPAVLADGCRPLQVALGTRHIVMIDHKARLWTWGDGALGQLGHGDIRPRLMPTLYSGAIDFKQVVSGPAFSFAITRAGRLVSWGDNSHGQLGFPPSHNGCIPAQLQSLRGETIVNVAVGTYHAVALTATGTAFSWGDNRFGALGRQNKQPLKFGEDLYGRENQDHNPTPMFLSGLAQAVDRHNDADSSPAMEASKLRDGECVVRIACGSHHTVVLTDSGLGYGCGEGMYGQLGRLDRQPCTTPRVIVTLASMQHLTGVFCSPHGTVLMSIPVSEQADLTARSYGAGCHDEYLTDLRILATIVPGAMFPTTTVSVEVAKRAAELTTVAEELVALHDKLPDFPRTTSETAIAEGNRYDASSPPGSPKSPKPGNEPEPEPEEQNPEELANFRSMVEAYAKYTELCNAFVDEYGAYLDVPRPTNASNQLWATYNRYDVLALGVLAQDFCSDWARDGAKERALASEQISLRIAENLLGRERHAVLDALPYCCARPAVLFAETVERVLQQFGESGAALATSEEAVVRQYEGYQWRFRTEGTANISLLNLLMEPLQRAELYLQEVTDARALQTLRNELKWIDDKEILRRPAFAELNLDLNFDSLGAEFEKQCIDDVAAGVDMPAKRIRIVRVIDTSGTISGTYRTSQVLLTFLPGPGKKKTEPAAQHLVDRMHVRSKDSSSVLRLGTITSSTIRVTKLLRGDLPDDVIMDVSQLTKKFKEDESGGFFSKISFRRGKKKKKKKKKKGKGKADEEPADDSDGTPGGFAVSRLGKARVEMTTTADKIEDKDSGSGRSISSAFLLALTDSYGGRVTDFAEFKVDRCASLCNRLPPPSWIPVVTLCWFPFLVLVLRLGMGSGKATAAFNWSVLLTVLPVVVILAVILRRVRKHPTLTLPVSKDLAARVDLKWPNLLARAALAVEFVQHNALGLAVATEWSALPELDDWLFWPGRGGAIGGGFIALCGIGLWLLCLHSILGRLSLERWPFLDAMMCYVLPCVISDACSFGILLGLLSVVPCTGSGCVDSSTGAEVLVAGMGREQCELLGNQWYEGRMLWQPEVECWGGAHTTASLFFVAAAMMWAASTTLVPLQLYYVRHELQVRQQHWWRMLLTLCKCLLLAAILATAQRNGYPDWHPTTPGIPGSCNITVPDVTTVGPATCADAGGWWTAPVLPELATCTDAAGQLLPIIEESDCEVPSELWPASVGIAVVGHLVLLGITIRTATMVAPRPYNYFRSYSYATAAWSAVCVAAFGMESGRELLGDSGAVIKRAVAGWAGLALVFGVVAACQRRRERSAVSPYAV